MDFRLDCRYFRGEKPCQFQCDCPGCVHYAPMGKRILIIKLAAMGDVLRTTTLLHGLKRKYPQSHVTWITDGNALPALWNNPALDRVFAFSLESVLRLEVERFDLLICLDKEARATALAMRVAAEEKKGFGLDAGGNIFPLNPESEYAFRLGLSDELKFRKNRKTYPELIFEMCGLEYQGDEYILELSAGDRDFAREKLKRLGVREGDFVIGLNTGAGSAFANKDWPPENFVELIRRLGRENRIRVLLLGGPEEVERNRKIMAAAGRTAGDTGCDNTIGQFAAIVDGCDLVVTGDTVCLHIAIARKKPVVAFFGPTCAQEVELYGRGKKLVAGIDCVPCYRKSCDRLPNCLETITVETVLSAIRDLRK